MAERRSADNDNKIRGPSQVARLCFYRIFPLRPNENDLLSAMFAVSARWRGGLFCGQTEFVESFKHSLDADDAQTLGKGDAPKAPLRYDGLRKAEPGAFDESAFRLADRPDFTAEADFPHDDQPAVDGTVP